MGIRGGPFTGLSRIIKRALGWNLVGGHLIRLAFIWVGKRASLVYNIRTAIYELHIPVHECRRHAYSTLFVNKFNKFESVNLLYHIVY